MKANEINTKGSTADQPSELAGKYLRHVESGGIIYDFLELFDWDSRAEVERFVRDLAICIYGDRYLNSKRTQEDNPYAKAIVKQFAEICTKIEKQSKLPASLSGELWHGGYSRKKLKERTDALLKVEPNAAEFMVACVKLKAIYNLTDLDIEKLRFFVEQVKAGERFPNSLRRMLYIWGKAKQTGKTTSGKMLTCILNGDPDYTHIDRYSSILTTEMQVGNFKVPRISECNCVLMDECFFADMGKMYADFKRFMTSSNGRARLPFGQEFEWEGQPNYISTSNDSLKRFIKDWGGRRYLSINFEARPTETMAFDDIRDLWLSFVRNSTPRAEWHEWSEWMADACNEDGERTERTNEYEAEMRQNAFLNYVLAETPPPSNSSGNPQNRRTLKFFVNYFTRNDYGGEAVKRRDEIEAAAINVFGDRYGTQNFWLLSDLQRVANELKDQNNELQTPTGAVFDDNAIDPTPPAAPF